jgi:hypothetical protein
MELLTGINRKIYKIVTGEGFFSLIFAESWRLFTYPFDEAVMDT